MFNFFLIIYLLKDTVEDFMEFTPSLGSQVPLDLRNINQVKDNSDKDYSNKNITPNNFNESLSNPPTLNSSQAVNLKIKLNSPTIEECDNSEESKTNNINVFKKTNNINLLNKNNISKANPSFKNKNYKKNKSKHPRHTKKG